MTSRQGSAGARMIALLRTLAPGQGLGNVEIAAALGIPPTSVAACAATPLRDGWIARFPDARDGRWRYVAGNGVPLPAAAPKPRPAAKPRVKRAAPPPVKHVPKPLTIKAAVPNPVIAKTAQAEIPPGVKFTRCPSQSIDPRYQVDPAAFQGGAFSRVGIGRDVDTGRGWGEGGNV